MSEVFSQAANMGKKTVGVKSRALGGIEVGVGGGCGMS